MSDYIQFQRLITYQWLNKEQLKLANDFILKQMNDDDYSEYYYDMFCFVEKCFKVLKKTINCKAWFDCLQRKCC